MPEGDTVWRTARRLHQALAGGLLTTTDFRVPAYAALDLRNRRVREVVARGKHLLTRVEPDVTIHTHLKMEGSWHVYRPGTPWRGPSHQVRLVLATGDWTAVGFRLGIVEVLATPQEDSVVDHLGPDVLGPDWDLDEAVRRLRRLPDRPLGEALLDQTNLAGIGNIYKAEVCFLTDTSPWTPIGEVGDLAGVVDTAQRLLRQSGTTRTDDHRRHPTRPAAVGVWPCRPAVPTLSYADPPSTGRGFQRGPLDVLVPVLPSRVTAADQGARGGFVARSTRRGIALRSASRQRQPRQALRLRRRSWSCCAPSPSLRPGGGRAAGAATAVRRAAADVRHRFRPRSCAHSGRSSPSGWVRWSRRRATGPCGGRSTARGSHRGGVGRGHGAERAAVLRTLIQRVVVPPAKAAQRNGSRFDPDRV